MGLFTNETPADKKKAHISHMADNALEILINSTRAGFDALWHSPDATPQEILNSFGSKATALFAVHHATQTFIKTLKPDFELLVPPVPFTMHEDGTVTINEEGS